MNIKPYVPTDFPNPPKDSVTFKGVVMGDLYLTTVIRGRLDLNMNRAFQGDLPREGVGGFLRSNILYTSVIDVGESGFRYKGFHFLREVDGLVKPEDALKGFILHRNPSGFYEAFVDVNDLHDFNNAPLLNIRNS